MGRMSDLHIDMQENLDVYIEHGGKLYEGDEVIDRVLKKFIKRADRGMVEYGVSMAENSGDLMYWLDHAIEEAMDLVNYLERIKMKVEKASRDNPELPLHKV